MSKHTKGPWLDIGFESPWGYVIKHNGGSSISYIAAYDLEEEAPEPYGKWDANSIANRSLVLAAPELLDALIWHRDALDLGDFAFYEKHGFSTSEVMPRTRAIVKKAEGATT